MPFTVPKVAISDLTTWHTLEPVDVAQVPGPDRLQARPLLPGSWRFEYWWVDRTPEGGPTERVYGRLLVAHDAPAAPAAAIQLPAGVHETWVDPTTGSERDIVQAGELRVGV